MNQSGTARRIASVPWTSSEPERSADDQPRSPHHTSVSVRRLDETEHRDVEPGIEVAHVDLLRLEHEPPVALAARGASGKAELHDRPASRDGVRRRRCGACPRSGAWGSRSTSPSSPIQRTPHAPTASTTVRSSSPASVTRSGRPCRRPAFDDAGALQLLQAARQQCRRHPRKPTAQVVEPFRAGDELTDRRASSTVRRAAPWPSRRGRTGGTGSPSRQRTTAVQIWY